MSTPISFTDRHEPGLKSGDYTINVTQSLDVKARSGDPSWISQETFPKQQRHFSVLGPRFTLDPLEIQELFPPPGSLGDHSNVLPHVILKRSTLPWERDAKRDANPAEPAVPWLALLLFDETENTQDIHEAPGKLGPLKKQALKFLDPESGDHDDDQVMVIDVRRSLLEQIIPTAQELKYLAHARQADKEEGAVLIGNRLPKPGGVSIVHLVSLEHRYTGSAFEYQEARPGWISLVSLRSWRFACVSGKQSFKGALTHLNHQLLFHFPPQVADPLVRKLNAQEIPDDIRAAFAHSASPLSVHAKVSEHSQWRIADQGNRSYLVSNLLHVCNQAGKKLFELKAAPSSKKLSEQADILARFEQSHHKLDPQKATIAKQAEADHWWITDGRKQYFISQESIDRQKKVLYVYSLDPDSSSTLRLPPLVSDDVAANAVAETYLKRGCVPIPHTMRQGTQAVSWYHGPLTPGTNTTAKDVLVRDANAAPIRYADALMRYNAGDGMLDVSYAAAWELGRLLTLKNTPVAAALFNWKRTLAHEEQLKKTAGDLAHRPYEPVKAKANPDIPPAVVSAWFDDLAVLHGVPFNYLVPDERMLPLESIRFFCVDGQWTECLLDGAFSVGRVVSIDHDRDRALAAGAAQSLFQRSHKIMSGVLIRSDVVSGWPGLLLDGYDVAGGPPLSQLRMERLSKNVLLCVFAGKVAMVDVHQKPETLHCGFSRSDSSANGAEYYKERIGSLGPSLWRQGNKRVVAIGTLVDTFRGPGQPTDSYQSAKFAVDMIEGVERVRFHS